MQISKEFLEAEIVDLQTEMRKAETFLIQAQATVSAYQMLVRRLEVAEPVEAVDTGE
jgi:hypothetical protein